MYMLSYLIEEYLWSEKNFNKRRIILYLEGWTKEMINAGRLPQSIYDFRADLSFEHNKKVFEQIIRQLKLLDKCNVTEINEDFLFQIVIDEYKHGYYDSASEFLYYKKYVADKLVFPFTIEYSEISDEYFTKDKIKQGSSIMSGNELENYVIKFLSDKIPQNP